MNKKNVAIYILGFVFMFLLLYYTFGNTANGMYCVGEIQSISRQSSEENELGPNEKKYSVRLKMLSGSYKNQMLDAQHYQTDGSAFNMEIATGDSVVVVIDKQPDQLIVGIDEHYKSRKLMFLIAVLIILIAIIAGINGMKAMLALFLP